MKDSDSRPITIAETHSDTAQTSNGTRRSSNMTSSIQTTRVRPIAHTAVRIGRSNLADIMSFYARRARKQDRMSLTVWFILG